MRSYIGEEQPDPDEEPDPDFVAQNNRSTSIPIDDDVLWKMYNTGASFRTLSTVLGLAFTTAGANARYCTSQSYLYQNYQRLLQVKESTFKETLRTDKSFGTICFDHQTTQKLTGKFEGTTHRIAVVWYSNQTHNAIGLIEMPDKSAESQDQAIRQICLQFGIDEQQIVALTCDNENTNVGNRSGTCILLEQAYNKQLLRLMCRHHIGEIVIKDVYHHLFRSDTPNNLFYGILKEIWSNLREADFPFTSFVENSFTEDFDLRTLELFEELKVNAMNELRQHSKSKNVRDDYREVTLLALKFFGENHTILKRNQVKFRTLINPSNARFMATVIQGIECYLFRRSIDWTGRVELRHNIKRFATFASFVYIRYWNRCTILLDAPQNDLNFLQELQIYESFDSSVAEAAINALNRHLHYLSEELAPLALFSQKTSLQEKEAMAEKLLLAEGKAMPQRNISVRNISNHIAYNEGNNTENYDWGSKNIVDFIGDRSNFFFDAMNLPRSFLRLHANEWNKNYGYIRAKCIIQRSLICINDASERVISNCKSKLMKQRCKKEKTFQQNMLSLNNN